MAAGSWTLLHMRSPLNTTSGTGQIAELTKASGRSMKFSTEKDGATLSFSMPGNHYQTSSIVPLASDVLVFRDDYPVQRFRVVTRALSRGNGPLIATFSCVSYKMLINGLIMHDTDTRSWASATEQSTIAWTILNQAQSKTYGALGITQGVVPAVSHTRIYAASTVSGKRSEYFAAGIKRGEAIEQIADNLDGFEWDIEPDRSSASAAYTALRFNTWNYGSRNQHSPRSPLLLNSGGTMASWSHTVTPSEYGNVLRYTGTEPTSENTTGATIVPAWYPATKNPAATPPEGRWERDINNSDLTTQAAINARAPQVYDEIHLYVPEIATTLARGRWNGPGQLWLGDKSRLIITEPIMDQPGEYVLYVDEDVRVVEIEINVDNLGAEDVTLSLNRPRFSAATNRRTVNDRLTRLERR